MASLYSSDDSMVRSKQIAAQQSEDDLPCPLCGFPSGIHSSSSASEKDGSELELTCSLIAV